MSKLLLRQAADPADPASTDIFAWHGRYRVSHVNTVFGRREGRPEAHTLYGKCPFVDVTITRDEDASQLSILQSHATQLGSMPNVQATARFFRFVEPSWKQRERAEDRGEKAEGHLRLRVTLAGTVKFWLQTEKGTQPAGIEAVQPHTTLSMYGRRICNEYMPAPDLYASGPTAQNELICVQRFVPSDVIVHKRRKSVHDEFSFDALCT